MTSYWYFTGDKYCAVVEIDDGKIANNDYETAAINVVLLPDSTENTKIYGE